MSGSKSEIRVVAGSQPADDRTPASTNEQEAEPRTVAGGPDDAAHRPAGGSDPLSPDRGAGAGAGEGDDGSSPRTADGRATAPSDGDLAADAGAKSAEVADDDEGAELQEDLDELTAIAAQRDEYLALAQRTQADFENFRKRMSREAAAAETRGIVRLTKELLPALDNLDRALSHAAPDDPLLEGVRLVHAELAAALARLGIESFSPAGEHFDPAEHEAMAQQPVDGAESGTVVEVYQPGYRFGGSVIRPARVVVAA
jgi:molecular chaperone GrpE